MGPEDPRPDSDWTAFRAARDRFFSRVRPEAMDDPPESSCPNVVPECWVGRQDGEEPGGAASG